jgi:hypothetical protein
MLERIDKREGSIYTSWRKMKDRCKYRETYKALGYDPMWSKYENFKKDMYESYLAHITKYGTGQRNVTIDRIDNYKGYSKDNCRWATTAQQNRNKKKRRYDAIIDLSESMTTISRRLGGGKNLVSNRLENGWTVEDAISIPVDTSRRTLQK